MVDATAPVAPIQQEDLPDRSLGDAFGSGNVVDQFDVTLSNEIVHLLSEQLYTSPLKAIEEIVVNAYDADASNCRIGLLLGDSAPEAPTQPTDKDRLQARTAPAGIIAIYDDGEGMDIQGLRDLWQVGASPKRGSGTLTKNHQRKVIGKFGIGKLATYAVANRITYITHKGGTTRHVTCDFTSFASQRQGAQPVRLSVRDVENLAALTSRPDMTAVLGRLGLKAASLLNGKIPSWTICVLDELKPKARDLQVGRLGWVLRTAMPLQSGFNVFLNGALVTSSKEDFTKVFSFTTGELADERIRALNSKSHINLTRQDDHLIEPMLFPSGIKGTAFVTDRSMVGKSSELMGRSHGFFVRVRGRVVNIDDELFNNDPVPFQTLNRLRVDLEMDDLHEDVTAPREGVGLGQRRDVAVAVAREIALQARKGYEDYLTSTADQKLAPEATRVYVAEHLVERPVADTLAMRGTRGTGADVDRNWLYLDDVEPAALSTVIEQLYEKRTRYNYQSVNLGREAKLARFDPAKALFTVNKQHQLVQAFQEGSSKELLDLIATAEVMLEVYMVESGIDRFVIGEILNRRDTLLRSLAEDRVYSRSTIADMLRRGFDSDIDLELAAVAAARALGFQVKHIGGSGQPDGIARYMDTTMRETVITIETKASQGVPSLGNLDFAGLEEHKGKVDASGCLLIAPSYPAGADPRSASAVRSTNGGISCWTVEQLALVVEAAERLEITTLQVAEIVQGKFTPQDVTQAVNALLGNEMDMSLLYRGCMDVLQRMFAQKTTPGASRKVAGVAAVLSLQPEFAWVTETAVRRALANLAGQSHGAMALTDDVIVFYVDFEEVVRRVASLTGDIGSPRKLGTFKAS